MFQLIFGAVFGVIGRVKVRINGNIDGVDFDNCAHGKLADFDDAARVVARFLVAPAPMPLVQLGISLLRNDRIVDIFLCLGFSYITFGELYTVFTSNKGMEVLP